MVIASACLAAAPKPAPPSDNFGQAALCCWQISPIEKPLKAGFQGLDGQLP